MPDPDALIGQTISHYRIVEKIGAGGMGVVYRARDEDLDRDVALKVLPIGVLSDEAARKRFRREVLVLANINHPNIATIHEFVTEDNRDFLVMEYVEGISLSQEIAANGPVPEKRLLALAAQVAQALQEAHERGVVHRDLKPGNIMINSKGLAKVWQANSSFWAPRQSELMDGMSLENQRRQRISLLAAACTLDPTRLVSRQRRWFIGLC